MSIHSKIYISLTTIPTRFNNIYPCIDSLLNQLFLPTKIFIQIPNIYNFRFNNSSISDKEIEDFKNHYSYTNLIEVNKCSNDWGPGTKLIGFLQQNIDLGDSFIILVDDDVVYDNTFLKGFISHFYHKSVASYCVYNYSNVLVGQGVDGFLMHGELLKDFLEYYQVIKDTEYINFHDDMYISFYFKLKKIIIHKVDKKETIYSNYNNCEALSNLDGDFSRENINTKCIELLNNYWIKKHSFDFLIN